MEQIDLCDLMTLQRGTIRTNTKLVNIRGANGAGKSTIPLEMLRTDPNCFEITSLVGGKLRIIATVFPRYNFLSVGHYHCKTGGTDMLPSQDIMKTAIKSLWELNYNIIVEGSQISTIIYPYIEFFSTVNNSLSKRDIIIYNLVPPVEDCIQRVYKRSQKQSFNEDRLRSKWNSIKKNVETYRKAGFKSLEIDNSGIPIENILSEFFKRIELQQDITNEQLTTEVIMEENKPIKKKKHAMKPILNVSVSTDFYVEPEENLKAYEWYNQYKAPNENLKINQIYFDKYWYFLHERMRIYEKRVLNNEPAPWTEDPILQTYKFTNVLRDMDKCSIYVKNNILAKIDEPVEDLELRKKSVLLNIMIYRLWVNTETYEITGFLDLADPNMLNKWEDAKKVLLQRREDGVSNFTNAYVVCCLKSKETDTMSSVNKTYNAVCLIDFWIKNIDEIYKKAIIDAKCLQDQVMYFAGLPCVGMFTAYEYACDITMTTRYCKNHLVEWSQDNGTNVGPGALRGINYIFIDKGGMSPYECIIYMRSIWKHEMQKRGYYEDFVRALPKEMNGEIDLRVIEHCLCECQKYNKALEGTGRPRVHFKPSTSEADLAQLKC